MKKILKAVVVIGFYAVMLPLCIFALISAVFEVLIEIGEKKFLHPLLDVLE